MNPAPEALPDAADGRRRALVIATSSYSDPSLRALRAPGTDAKALADVLGDPTIGSFEVTTVLDESTAVVQRRLAEFSVEGAPRDLAVVYLSCHGLLDDRGRLYYATADTDRNWLSVTAVSAQWLNEQLEECRCRQQVVILDCCHSGAFAVGSKGDSALQLRRRFEARGRVVLTASRATEYSFEDDGVVGDGAASVFTRALVSGLSTGSADLDRDGLVTVNELYSFAYDAVVASDARQTPSMWAFGAEGKLVVARNPVGAVVEPARLPEDLWLALHSPRPRVRLSAVHELGELLESPDAGVALAARNALTEISAREVPLVADAARAVLTGAETGYASSMSSDVAVDGDGGSQSAADEPVERPVEADPVDYTTFVPAKWLLRDAQESPKDEEAVPGEYENPVTAQLRSDLGDAKAASKDEAADPLGASSAAEAASRRRMASPRWWFPHGRARLIAMGVLVAGGATALLVAAVTGGEQQERKRSTAQQSTPSTAAATAASSTSTTPRPVPQVSTAEARDFLDRFIGRFNARDREGLLRSFNGFASYRYLGDSEYPAEDNYRALFEDVRVAGYRLSRIRISTAGTGARVNARYRYSDSSDKSRAGRSWLHTGKVTFHLSDNGEAVALDAVVATPDLVFEWDLPVATTVRVKATIGEKRRIVVGSLSRRYSAGVHFIVVPLNAIGRKRVKSGSKIRLAHSGSGDPGTLTVGTPYSS